MSLTSSIPVLRAADYPRARDFFTAFGFRVAEEGGDPPRFGIFKREAATVFVDASQGPDAAPSPGWRAYFHADDVDALASEVMARGLEIEGPTDAVYGMREIVVTDPDGNRLCFGEDIA